MWLRSLTNFPKSLVFRQKLDTDNLALILESSQLKNKFLN